MLLNAALTRWLVVFKREPWWAEFWSALACLSWGAYSMYLPTRMEMRYQLDVLTQLASGTFWEVTAMCLGTTQFIALIWNERLVRWAVALVASWWWSMHFVAFLAVDPQARTVVFFVIFALLNLLSVARLLKVY